MREIRFRGRGTSGDYRGVWAYGDLSRSDMRRTGLCTIWMEDRYFITGISVDPETVGQFTGLKDKNGKDIYEGDIVGTGRGVSYCVRYQCGEWVLVESDGGWVSLAEEDLDVGIGEQLHGLEVIGNVHDNPALLEEYGELKRKLSVSIQDCGLTGRARSVVFSYCHGCIETVGDLCRRTRDDLLCQPGCGRTTLRQIEDLLGSLGLSLDMDVDAIMKENE